MARESLLSLPNELIFEIASGMCIRDIIVLLETVPSLQEPLWWHCCHQDYSARLEGLIECVDAGDIRGTRLLLSVDADIKHVEGDPDDRSIAVYDHQEQAGYCWNSRPLNKALQRGHEEIADAIVEHILQIKTVIPGLQVDDVERTMQLAAQRGYSAIVKALLDLRSNLRKPLCLSEALSDTLFGHPDSDGNDFCLCSTERVSGSGRKTKGDYFGVVELLLDSGVSSDWPKHHQEPSSLAWGPMSGALFRCRSMSNGIVRLLIERGAGISKETVLHAFVRGSNQCVRSQVETAKLLIQNGADVNARDAHGGSVLHKVNKEELVELFIDHGLDPNATDDWGQTPLHAMAYCAPDSMVGPIRSLLEHGADLAATNVDGNTPLHLAIATSDWEVVELLVDYGADLHCRNHLDETPMSLMVDRHPCWSYSGLNRDQSDDRWTTYQYTMWAPV